uniref:Si:dkey-182g1.10 n=1 Tax=Cyprinus carpio TaxID=7962 RepID=A0A8C2C2D4_CYPCA
MVRNMKNLIVLVFFLFFANGVFGFETDGVKSISVMEGDSVTLHMCLNQIQKYEKILWKFENTLIAQFDKASQTFSTKDGNDGRFRNRLELNTESGSLTIRNIRTNHSGVYKVDMISTSGSSNRRFNVTVIGVFDPDAEKIKPVSAKEGESVTLNTNFNVQKDDLMVWNFGRATKHCVYNPLHHVPCQSDVSAIAKIDGETREVSLDAGDSEMFSNRLKMDKLTGSLTITNSRPEHSGFYILQISNNNGTKYRRFNVTVSAITKSHSHVVWMSIAIVLLLMVALWCLAVGFKNWRNRNFLLGKLRSYNCCQSTGAQEPELIPKSVIEGEPVTLNTDRTELQRDDVIEWKFGGKVIAKISRAADKICQKTYDGAYEKFRNRLKLDQTGSLTITNTRTTDSGDYQLQIATNGKVEQYRKFNVSVIDSSQNIPKESAESPLMSEERCSSSNMELV